MLVADGMGAFQRISKNGDILGVPFRVSDGWADTEGIVIGENGEIISVEDDPERRRMMANSSLMSRTLWSMTYANISQGQCFECMRVCPVDERHRALGPAHADQENHS